MAGSEVTSTPVGSRIVQRNAQAVQSSAGKRRSPAKGSGAAPRRGVASSERDGRRLDVLAAAHYLGVTVRHLRQLVFERRLGCRRRLNNDPLSPL
jgi:hypothetical protein